MRVRLLVSRPPYYMADEEVTISAKQGQDWITRGWAVGITSPGEKPSKPERTPKAKAVTKPPRNKAIKKAGRTK